MNRQSLSLWLLIGLLLSVLSVVSSAQAQYPFVTDSYFPVSWDLSIVGSTASSWDSSIITISNFEHSSTNTLVIKITNTGLVKWAMLFGDGNSTMSLSAITVSDDGSIVLSGSRNQNPMLMCLNIDGSLRWCRQYNIESATGILEHCATADHGFSAVGNTKGAGLLLKTDSVGAVEWCIKSIMTNGTHIAFLNNYSHLVACKDTSIVVVGTGQDTGLAIMPLVRFSGSGDPLSEAEYNVSSSSFLPQQLLQVSDGSLMLTAGLVNGKTSVFMHLLDVDRLRWSKSYSFFRNGLPMRLYEESDTIMLAMIVPQPTFDSIIQIVRIDTSGNITEASECQTTTSRGYTVTAMPYAGSQYYIASTTMDGIDGSHLEVASISSSLAGCHAHPVLASSGEMLLTKASEVMEHTAVTVTTDNAELVVQSIVVLTSIVCNNGTSEVSMNASSQPLLLYPNPVSVHSYITIASLPLSAQVSEIILRDLTGREVYRMHREAASAGEQIQIPTAGLASGVYTIELLDASSFANVWRGKVVVE